MEDVILVNKGGWATLECWQPDIGAVPYEALFSCPDLGVSDFKRATIYRDGSVRARLNPSQVKEPGTYEATWKLQVPVIGNVLADDADPITEEIEVLTTITVTDDPADIKPPEFYWKDAVGLPTPKYLRDKYLFGVPPIDAEGRCLPDSALQFSINAAVRRFENRLGITIAPRLVLADYDPATLKPEDIQDADGNPLPIKKEAAYDYDPSWFRKNYNYLGLRHYPARKLLSMQLWLGPTKITEIPPEWFQFNSSRSQLQLMPGALTGLSLPGSLALPVASAAFAGAVVPHLWHVAYVAGLEEVDMSLFEAIVWAANQIMLIIISDSLIAGVASQSTSIDGISESITLTASAENSTYAANIKELDKRIENWLKEQADSYTGLRFTVI